MVLTSNISGRGFLRRTFLRLLCLLCLLVSFVVFSVAQSNVKTDSKSDSKSDVKTYSKSDVLLRAISLDKGYVGSTDSLISLISSHYDITISYSNKVYANQSLSIAPSTISLNDLLSRIFSRFPVEYVVREGRSPKVIVAPQKVRYFTLSGYCHDALTGEVLIGANVYDSVLYVGQATNDYGFFSMTLPEGLVGAKASFVGYRTKMFSVNLHSDTLISLRLEPSLLLADVQVFASESGVPTPGTGTVEIPMEQIKNMPSLLGETDVIKALQWTPGVQGGEEGFGGMSVRGGSSDQNIVMLDDVPLYSPNHLAGLYSVFNSESVNNATLIKGGFPARYGGRMSSVLDVKMKDGNMQHFGGYVNIGLLASNATLEGPIIKDKMSFIVSARRTYFDIFSSQLQRYSDQRYSFFFYDIHAKLNYIISPRDRIYVGFFTGYDNLEYGYNYRNVNIDYKDGSRVVSVNDNRDVRWGNIVASSRWNHVFGSSLFANTTIAFSRYRFRNRLSDYADSKASIRLTNGYYSGINDYSARVDFTWYSPFLSKNVSGQDSSPSHIVRFGTNATYHCFYPGVFVYSASVDSAYYTPSNLDASSHRTIYRFENHTYLENEMKLGRWNVNAGIHVSAIKSPGRTFLVRFEPRVLAGVEISDRVNVRLGYSDMTQFIQLLRMVSVASPADMWMPSSSVLPVPHSWQASSEVEVKLGRYFSFTGEIYHKKYINQQTSKSSSLLAETILNNDWDGIYTSGNGYANGVEFFLHRKAGRISGWLGYTVSNARSQFYDINDGEPFDADNDRTHSVSVFGCYKFNDIIDISATWQYNTGAPTTISDSHYTIRGTDWTYSVPVSGLRNAYRMPASHTLNIGVNIKRESGRTERLLSCGIYNVYAHKNPVFVYWKQVNDPETGQEQYKLKQFSLIAWPWPYVKYSIKF